MTKSLVAYGCLSVAVFISACGTGNAERASSETPRKQTTAVSSSSGDSQPDVNAANENTQDPATSETAETQQPAGTGSPETPYQRKLDKLQKIRDAANTNGGSATPEPNWRPAPENSLVSVTLTDIAVETRVFKSHPQLAKVVKISGPSERKIVVYLRNGNSITLPGDRIKSIGQESSANILAAAGVAGDDRAKTRSATKPGS